VEENKGAIMNTGRSRILIVLIAAAIVVSFFTHWEDFAAGFRDGFKPVSAVSYQTKESPAALSDAKSRLSVVQVTPFGRQVVTPGRQVVTPGRQVVSPGRQVVTPGRQVVTPGRQVVTPGRQVVSPGHQVVTPGR
jgi:hypothetical protein